MKKENIHKVLYLISAWLVAGFAITFGIDAYRYNPPFTGSAPLYVHALIRAIQFIIPSIIVFIVGIVVKNKTKKE